MYAVRIFIDAGKDFGYVDPEFNTQNKIEKTFYFPNRKEAANALVRSFHNFNKTLNYNSNNDNLIKLERWVNNLDKKIELICRKIPSFTIDKYFGNYRVKYCLLDINREVLKNGSFTHTESASLDFIKYEKNIDWKMVMLLKDCID